MKYITLIAAVVLVLSACKKEDPIVANSFSEARYTLTISGQWQSPDFSVPAGAHFTTFIGMVHNNAATLWKENELASPGMEVLAETGGGAPILAEIDSTIRSGNGLSLLLFVAPPVNANINTNFYCNSNFSHISFASMLGPTPDWFTGLSSVRLYQNDRWIQDTTIQLYTFDAGTEQGNIFGYNNPPSAPLEPIHLLTPATGSVLANGNPTLKPIAKARFIKQ
ncbi:MAG: spondin domain-containing protein [Bacteroidetes bacterium]|nr:spondin domain-containing protein [Bacteroidota bacterium]